MAKDNFIGSELGHAADALEKELVTLEALSRSVQKIRLNSEKNILRASKELTEAIALPDRLAQGLQALSAAMAKMQARQQAALEPLAMFATEIQRRMQSLSDHMAAFAALGQAAGEVTALLQAAGADPAAVSADADAKLAKIGEGARALFEATHADDFPDVAREADSLKQRVSALRRRLEVKS